LLEQVAPPREGAPAPMFFDDPGAARRPIAKS
jgi:hypothetical protein